MITFLYNLLKNSLGFSSGQSLGTERAHRTLTTKPNGCEKPRSIVMKFYPLGL